jgi:ABC-2 type transport system permease protein
MKQLDVKKNLKIFWQIVKINVKKSLIYRINFLITFIAMILWIGLYVVFFEVIFSHIDSLAGWEKEEVMIFLAFYYLFQGFRNIFYSDGFDGFGRKIRRGEIDPYLTKPASLQMLSFLQDVRFDHLIDLVMTGLLFLYIALAYDYSFSLPFLAMGILLCILGTLLFYGVLLMIASFVFYIEKLDSLNSIVWNITQVSRYPRQIYTKLGKIIFQFIFPIALITSIPAEMTLANNEWEVLIYFCVISVVALFLGNFFFSRGVKHYDSAN